jgi:hypothetical protein
LKEFIFDCVNPGINVKRLSNVVDNAREIQKSTFMKNCNVDESIRENMMEFPNDYRYFKSSEFYFYTWSCIEFFYGVDKY